MDKFNISINEYLGKVEDGILILIGIVYNERYYEGTFFYNDKDIILTISNELEEIVGNIKEHDEYITILKTILRKIVPYDEMINNIDPVDFGRWANDIINQLIK